MKIFLKILLTILFVPVFLVLLILLSVKFQLLKSNFWIDTFERNGVYQNLEDAVPSVADSQTEEGSEIEIDDGVLKSIVTKDNLKLVFEKNIKFTLDYLNGISNTWIIFVPREKLPKNFLPNFLATMDTNEISLQSVLSLFSRAKGETIEVPYYIPILGRIVLFSLIVWLVVTAIFSFILYKLKVLNVSLIVSGLFVLLLSGAVALASKVIRVELLKEAETSQLLLGTLAPPIVQNIITLWIITGVSVVLLGILMGYLQKPKKLK